VIYVEYDGKSIGTGIDLAPRLLTALYEQRPGNISEIRKPQLVVFSDIEKLLDA